MSASTPVPSTQPYFVRALHEWCTDNGFTPYMSVRVDGSVRVPMAYVQEGEIVLNTSYDATSHLQIDNESVRFQARFGGVMHDILIPIGRIQAVFARENGQGMGFEVIDEPLADELEEVEDLNALEALDEPLDAAIVAPAPQTPALAAERNESIEAEHAETAPAQDLAPTPQRSPLSAVPSADTGLPSDEPPPAAPTGAGKKRPALRLVK